MSFGVYLHVPYCRSVCPYCAFNVVAVRRQPPHEALAAAMCAQSERMASAFAGRLRTVYFGGGTPSLLPADFFAKMLGYLRKRFDASELTEVTVEVEPNTAGQADLAALRALGVNRLSIGWQSGQDSVLKRLGRNHTAADTLRLIAAARAAGFTNISVDWLLASPGQTAAEFAADLAAVCALPVAHVSCYLLAIEPNTQYAKAVGRGALLPFCDDTAADWLTAAAKGLGRAGFGRYEVASFARPGHKSAHNGAYWSGRPYLGLGPGAHSFARDGWRTAWRWQARKQVAAYLRAGEAWRATAAGPPKRRQGRGACPIEPADVDFVETLSQRELSLERIMLGLRRPSGVSLADPVLRPHAEELLHNAAALCTRGWARWRRRRLQPTPLGLLHADAGALLLAGDQLGAGRYLAS